MPPPGTGSGARRGRRAALASLLALASGSAAAQVLELDVDGSARWIGGSGPAAEPQSASAAAGPQVPAAYRPAFAAAARRYGLSEALLWALAASESGFDARAVSPAGAIGVMQLMPATARELGVDPRDPVQNISGGAAYLRQQLDRFDGDLERALAAYNAGPAQVARHQGVPPFRETQAYVARNLERLAGDSLRLPAQAATGLLNDASGAFP